MISLKPLRPADSECLFKLIQNSKAHLTQNGDYKDLIDRDLRSTKIDLSQSSTGQESFGVFLDNKIIGTATLIRYSRTVYGLGYWIGDGFQGHGYMTEAVSWLITYAKDNYSATEIWAGIKHANTPSIKLVKRLGFELRREQETHLSFQLCPVT
ncbi:MAG: GNAT family N-acetyltransferase [bacterium]|nr:N-acetyltransferase [Gammaproteobacteria bacterium]